MLSFLYIYWKKSIFLFGFIFDKELNNVKFFKKLRLFVLSAKTDFHILSNFFPKKTKNQLKVGIV